MLPCAIFCAALTSPAVSLSRLEISGPAHIAVTFSTKIFGVHQNFVPWGAGGGLPWGATATAMGVQLPWGGHGIGHGLLPWLACACSSCSMALCTPLVPVPQHTPHPRRHPQGCKSGVPPPPPCPPLAPSGCNTNQPKGCASQAQPPAKGGNWQHGTKASLGHHALGCALPMLQASDNPKLQRATHLVMVLSVAALKLQPTRVEWCLTAMLHIEWVHVGCLLST